MNAITNPTQILMHNGERVVSTGELGARLGFNVPVRRLKELGLQPALEPRLGTYWRERDVPIICALVAADLLQRGIKMMDAMEAART